MFPLCSSINSLLSTSLDSENIALPYLFVVHPVISSCHPLTFVSRLCSMVSKVFKGKEVEKGVAFPTCISLNK